jgi:hypothetical protein
MTTRDQLLEILKVLAVQQVYETMRSLVSSLLHDESFRQRLLEICQYAIMFYSKVIQMLK